jgi:hypothetical protein
VVGVTIVAAAGILTAFARSSASPAGPRYGYPSRPCSLITAATLAKYLPGARYPVASLELDPLGNARFSGCGFLIQKNLTSCFLRIYLYGPAGPTAQQGFGYLVRTGEEPLAIPGVQFVRRTQTVTHLGNQATAIIGTAIGPPQDSVPN